MNQLNNIFNEVSSDLNIDKKAISSIYRSYCKAIVRHLSSLPLKTDLTKDDFDKLYSSVNISSIGKIYCTYNKLDKIKTCIKEKKK